METFLIVAAVGWLITGYSLFVAWNREAAA